MTIVISTKPISLTMQESGGKRTYQAVLSAYSTTGTLEEFSPHNVKVELASNPLPATYDGFGGADSADSGALLSALTIGDIVKDASRPSSICYRPLNVTYETLDPGGGPQDEPDSDPATWKPIVTTRDVPYQIEQSHMVFMGRFDAGTAECDPCQTASVTLEAVGNSFIGQTPDKMPKDSCQPVQNALARPYENPPIINKYDEEITIEVFRSTLDLSANQRCYYETINNAAFKIDIPSRNFEQLFEKHECMLKPIEKEVDHIRHKVSGDFITFWRLKYTLLRRVGGWYFDFPNKDTHRAPKATDPGPDGQPLTGAIAKGLAEPVARLDGFGKPIVKSDWIDGDGNPTDTPNYMRYRPHEKNFLSTEISIPFAASP